MHLLCIFNCMFLTCLSILFVILIRIFTVMFITFKEYRHGRKKCDDKIKTLIVIGSGGHTTEMMYLVEALNPDRYCPRLYIIANSDMWSENKVHEYEDKLKKAGVASRYEVFKIPRSRNVHQSYFTSVFTTLYSTLTSVPITFKFNPDMILCNGPGTCIPICVISFLMRCLFISTNTIVFVESVCRVTSMSLSGKILQWFADEILVQWPELKLKSNRAKYLGRVI